MLVTSTLTQPQSSKRPACTGRRSRGIGGDIAATTLLQCRMSAWRVWKFLERSYINRVARVAVDLDLGESLQLPKSYLYLMGMGEHAPPEDAMHIRVNTYPQLRQLCWNRPNNAVVDGETALALYERNWRFVDQDAITPREQKLLDHLIAEYGNGQLLAA